MNLFTGNPSALKKHFLAHIKELKQNPLDKVLVVLPSKHLESHLKEELCEEKGAITGITFLGISALASEINNSAKNIPQPLLKDTPLTDFRIKNILEKYSLPTNKNYILCLKNSFRDLINAQVPPNELSSLQEAKELITPQQRDYLAQLTLLYNDFLNAIKIEGKSTYNQYFICAKQNVKGNTFLTDFKEIIFYGFYDFTALHLELFKEIVKNFSTQVYFPFEDIEAYNFVKNFFELSILPLAENRQELPPEDNLIREVAQNIFTPTQKRVRAANIKVISVFGDGEVYAAAKEILRLKKEGYSYKDICLTYRAENTFNDEIIRIFKQNKIPLNYNFTAPLLQKPYVAFVFNLLNLATVNFNKEDVCAVLNSPFLKDSNPAWDSVLKNSGAQCSLAQYKDLLPRINENLSKQILTILEEINKNISALSESAPFDELAQKAEKFITSFSTTVSQKENIQTWQQIKEILSDISSYSQVRKMAKKGEFLEEFLTLLQTSTFKRVENIPTAVKTMDIMSLRLQHFKVVIILGLNEGILPLNPQQDPVLKEVYRAILQKIGCSVHTQQDRYQEEKFLFYLSLSAAQDRALLTFSQSDNDGKSQVASLYLTYLLNVLGLTLKHKDVTILSRRATEKYAQTPFEFLTKQEASIFCALTAQNKKMVLNAILRPENTNMFEENINNLAALSSEEPLNNFDGVIKQRKTLSSEIMSEGISPSTLRNIYTCPLKFLLGKILKEKEQELFSRGAISPKNKGNLYHKILENFYKNLAQKNMLQTISPSALENILEDFLKQELALDKYKDYGLYPILWQVICETMHKFIKNATLKDIQQMQEEKMFPLIFEEKLKDIEIPIKNTSIKLKGIVDRVDTSLDGKTAKIIDYKTSLKTLTMENLIFKEGILQPPLYLEMMQQKQGDKTNFINAVLFALETDKNPFKELPLDKYQQIKPKIEEVLSFLLDLVQGGIFPLRKNDTCVYCDYKEICRKNHAQTSKRAQRSMQSKTLRRMHDYGTNSRR